MQNKTPILVFTGLAIVAAAAIAGLTKDRWMGETTPPVAAVTVEAPAKTEAPPAPEAPKTTEQTAAAEAPAKTEAPETTEQTATPEAPVTPEQTAVAEAPAKTETTETTEQPAATAEAPSTPEAPAEAEATQPAAPAAKTNAEPTAPPAETSQQAAATPEPPAAPAVTAVAPVVPAFDTVRVEKTGEAVIAGTAAPGAAVVLKLDGKDIGQTTANDDGAFVIVPEQPLPAGSGALTLEANAPGETAAVSSAQSVAVIVPEAPKQEALVAVVSPDQPTKVLQKPATPEPAAAPAPAQETETETAAAPSPKTPEAPAKPAKLVSIDAVDYDAAGNIVFSGQGEQGNTARIYIDNNFIGDAAVGPDGRWSFSGTADVAPGVHTLRVDGLDAKGEVVNRVEVPFFREAQSKVAEASPASPEAPAAAEAPKTDAGTAAPPPPRDGRVVIQPGNNLWRISRVLYGTGAKYTVLYEANKDQIRNPDLIYPGQVFKTPDVAAKFESVDPRRREPLKPDENAAPSQ